jgi:hypothetical protein
VSLSDGEFEEDLLATLRHIGAVLADASREHAKAMTKLSANINLLSAAVSEIAVEIADVKETPPDGATGSAASR